MAATNRGRRGLGTLEELRHGEASTYGNYGCRCEPCKAAWAERARKYRLRRTIAS